MRIRGRQKIRASDVQIYSILKAEFGEIMRVLVVGFAVEDLVTYFNEPTSSGHATEHAEINARLVHGVYRQSI